MSELFDDEFLAGCARLSLDARPAPASDRAGAHQSRAAGASPDFRDYRPYTPGDDLRRVDWNVYRRSGHLFVRRFEHPAATPLYVLVDNSASMFVERPTRYAAAARVAAAVAAAGLRNHDAVSVMPYAGDGVVGVRGTRRLPEVLGLLERLNGEGQATLASAVGRVSQLTRRSGVVVVVSDFFEEDGVPAIATALDGLNHRVVMVEVTQPWDLEPEMSGEEELVDCETGGGVAVAGTARAIELYKRAYAAHQAALRELAVRRASAYASIDASADVLPQLEVLFPDGVLRVKGWAAQ